MTLFKLGKYKYDLLFRPKVFWLGVYPNPKRGTVCIAFFMVVLRITNTKHKYQDILLFYKDCLLAALQQLNDNSTEFIITKKGSKLKVNILQDVIKKSKSVKNYA